MAPGVHHLGPFGHAFKINGSDLVVGNELDLTGLAEYEPCQAKLKIVSETQLEVVQYGECIAKWRWRRDSGQVLDKIGGQFKLEQYTPGTFKNDRYHQIFTIHEILPPQGKLKWKMARVSLDAGFGKFSSDQFILAPGLSFVNAMGQSFLRGSGRQKMDGSFKLEIEVGPASKNNYGLWFKNIPENEKNYYNFYSDFYRFTGEPNWPQD